jgi:hypothetical protein
MNFKNLFGYLEAVTCCGCKSVPQLFCYRGSLHKIILYKKQSSPATRHGGSCGERRYSSYSFLTSALDGGEWSASRPGRALPHGKDPRYPLYTRLVYLRTGLDTEVRGKILCPCRGSNPDSPVVQSVVRHYNELPRL